MALESRLEWREVGWEGAGWGEVCMGEWKGVVGEGGSQELSFEVVGRSKLFGTVATVTHSFTLFSPITPSRSISSSLSSRQLTGPPPNCNPTLWDSSLNSLYGIQSFPSGLTLLPSSLRSSTFSITTKALSPCSSQGISKDILHPFTFNWTFFGPIPEGLADVNPYNWSMGSKLNIPSLYMEDRRAFPLNQPVRIQIRIILSFVIFFY